MAKLNQNRGRDMAAKLKVIESNERISDMDREKALDAALAAGTSTERTRGDSARVKQRIPTSLLSRRRSKSEGCA